MVPGGGSALHPEAVATPLGPRRDHDPLGLRETDEEHRRVLAVLTWLGVRQRGR